MTVLAIDPGNKQSAIMELVDGVPANWSIEPNDRALQIIEQTDCRCDLAIEGIASYGMAVGKEVFDTCIWIGKFWQASHARTKQLIYRMEVKDHLCHDRRAKDANIRQALIDRFGGPQECKKGGRLYGISKDVWSALAVALTYADTQKEV